MVKKYFKGYLKPPFDTRGRSTAGMAEDVRKFILFIFKSALKINKF